MEAWLPHKPSSSLPFSRPVLGIVQTWRPCTSKPSSVSALPPGLLGKLPHMKAAFRLLGKAVNAVAVQHELFLHLLASTHCEGLPRKPPPTVKVSLPPQGVGGGHLKSIKEHTSSIRPSLPPYRNALIPPHVPSPPDTRVHGCFRNAFLATRPPCAVLPNMCLRQHGKSTGWFASP